MTTNEIIDKVLEHITNDGYIDRRGRRVYSLGTTLSLGPSLRATVRNSYAAVRYQSLSGSDGVTYSFRLKQHYNGRNPLSPGCFRRCTISWMQHEVWICGDRNRYYFIPSYVIANFCSRPGSYFHEDYDPVHRLVHINTKTHQCCYTGKSMDFSSYYRAELNKESANVYGAQA